MIRWQLHLLWPLMCVLWLLAAFALYVFVATPRLYRLKLVLIPALVAAVTFSFPWFATRLGYAHPAGLPASFEYVAHKLILEDSRKTWLDVLVVSREPLERDARLHRMPWSQQLEDALKRAQKMQREGGTIEMRRGEGDAMPDWMPRRVQPQEVTPKDPLPQDRNRNRDNRPEDLLAPQGPAV